MYELYVLEATADYKLRDISRRIYALQDWERRGPGETLRRPFNVPPPFLLASRTQGELHVVNCRAAAAARAITTREMANTFA